MNSRTNIEVMTVSHGIHVLALANASAIAGAAAYVLCALVTAFAPGLYLAIIQTWAHGIGVATLQAGAPPMDAGRLIVGLVTFTAFVWIASAATAGLYNRLSR